MSEHTDPFNEVVMYKTVQRICYISCAKTFWDVLSIQLAKLDVYFNCELLGPLVFDRTQ
jgi:hypothetical protein